MKKRYEFNDVVINVGDVYSVEGFYNYLGEDFHDAVSFDDFLNNDVAYNSTCLLAPNGVECVVIEYTVENDTLTITNID